MDNLIGKRRAELTFSSYILEAGSTVKVRDSAKNQVDFHWLDGRGTWNNKDSDPAELYNVAGGTC